MTGAEFLLLLFLLDVVMVGGREGCRPKMETVFFVVVWIGGWKQGWE
jgi:hypothetical protein